MIYLRLAMVIAFMGVCAMALWYRGNAIDAEASAAILTRDLATAVGQIGDLEAQQKRNDEITLGLAAKLAEIRTDYVQAVKDVADLRGKDDAVSDYLNTDVPPALTSVLDRRAPAPGPSKP